MYLTSSSVASWLTQRGLIDPAAITSGQFAVQEVEHHNRGFLVYRPTDAALYVKQLREFDRLNILCIERESAFGAAVAKCRSAPWLTSRIPRFLDYDARHHAVTVQLLPETENLHLWMEQAGSIPDSVARGVGDFIGQFSSVECNELLASIHERLCPGTSPWILSFPVDQGAGFLSPANARLLSLLQSDDLITTSLDNLRSNWKAVSLMHGDLKWNNILVATDGVAEPDWYVIDWEMLDRGDPLWDLATMVQCWWYYWILSTPTQYLTDLDDLRARRMQAFEETRPSLDALWDGFQTATGLSNEVRVETRRTVARFAAARLLQTVYELLHSEESMGVSAEIMVQMSRRMLESPESLSEFLPGAES